MKGKTFYLFVEGDEIRIYKTLKEAEEYADNSKIFKLYAPIGYPLIIPYKRKEISKHKHLIDIVVG